MKSFFIGLRDYFKALLGNWVSLISGIGSIIFLIIGLITNFKTENQQLFWYWAFGICYVIASFSVWYRDRPRTSVIIEDFVLLSDKDLRLIFTAKILINNSKLERNSILDWNLEVKLTNKYHAAETLPGFVLRASGGSRISPITLEQNIPQTHYVSFAFPAEYVFDKGMTYDDVPYKLSCNDVLGYTYTLKGRTPSNVVERPHGRPQRSLTFRNPFRGYRP